MARAFVSRLLDDDAVARIDQDARHEVQPLLRAADDDDLLGVYRARRATWPRWAASAPRNAGDPCGAP